MRAKETQALPRWLARPPSCLPARPRLSGATKCHTSEIRQQLRTHPRTPATQSGDPQPTHPSTHSHVHPVRPPLGSCAPWGEVGLEATRSAPQKYGKERKGDRHPPLGPVRAWERCPMGRITIPGYPSSLLPGEENLK